MNGLTGVTDGSPPTPPRLPVIAAVDGSPASLEALSQGWRLAGLMGAALTAVNVWRTHYGANLPKSWTPEKDSHDLLVRAVKKAVPDGEDEILLLTVEGEAADQLIQLSRDAQLLVLGSRGHSGLSGFVLGSVSTDCAAHAHCPVLVTHPASAAHPAPVTHP